MSVLNKIVKSNKGYEIGHISHRKDGDYKKVGKDEWEKVENDTEKKLRDNKEENTLNFSTPRNNGIGGEPKRGETGIKWSISDMDDDELVIDDIYVKPEDRKKGLGKKLVESALEYAKEKGFKTVGLYAEPQTNDGMDTGELVEWYRSLGFESDPDADELMTYEL
jgi:ribosomal protein S18 acetylase RimI-like enzyme